MSRYILGQAVACGGTARGFAQGAASASCGVFASDWLADRLAGTDTVFQKTDPVGKKLESVAACFAGKPDSGVDGRYLMGSPADSDGMRKVLVTVWDRKPTADYAATATTIKGKWGTMAVTIEPRVTAYLREKAGLLKPEKDVEYKVSEYNTPAAGPADGSAEKQARLALLACFRKSGMNLWSLTPVNLGNGHFMATHVTAAEFWIFDSLVGEATIPLDQLDNWFGSPEVVNYLNKYRIMTRMNFVPQRQYG